MKEASLYVVLALKQPGPKWREVTTEPIPRQQAVTEIQRQWRYGRFARLRPVQAAA